MPCLDQLAPTPAPTPGNAADFSWQQDDVFGRIASRYDRHCDLFSLGLHRLWKRRLARVIADEPWATLLDGATGTGDIILRLLAHERVAGRTVIASDISEAVPGSAWRATRPTCSSRC